MANDINDPVDQAIDAFISRHAQKLAQSKLPPTGVQAPNPSASARFAEIMAPGVPKSPLTMAGSAMGVIPGVNTAKQAIQGGLDMRGLRTAQDFKNQSTEIAAGAASMLLPGIPVLSTAAKVVKYAMNAAKVGTVAAGAQGIKQVADRVAGMPDVPKTGLEAAQEMGMKGMIPAAAGELAGPAIAKTAVGVGKVAGELGVGKAILKLGEFFTGMSKEAVKHGAKNPHLTTGEIFNEGSIKGIAKNLAEGVKEAEDTVRLHYDLATKNAKKVSGKTIVQILDEEMPSAGFKKVKGKVKRVLGLHDASDEIADKLAEVRKKTVAEVKRNKELTANHLLSLRSDLKDVLTHAKSLGLAKGTHIINNITDRINGLMDKVMPSVRQADKQFGGLIDTVNDLKTEFGLPKNLKDAESIPMSALKRIQRFVEDFYKKGDAEIGRVKEIATKIGKYNEVVEKGADVATAAEFSGQGSSNGIPMSGAAKIIGNMLLKSRPLFGKAIRGSYKAGEVIAGSGKFNSQAAKAYLFNRNENKKR